VVLRVRADYSSQLTELQRTAEPLKQRARAEYSKLSELLGKVTSVAESLAQDKEEIELRHQLGEFDEKEFAKQSGEVTKTLEKHELELKAMEDLRESFISVFDSEEDLMTAHTPAPPPSARPVPPPHGTGAGSLAEMKGDVPVDGTAAPSLPAIDRANIEVPEMEGTVLLDNDQIQSAMAGEQVDGATSILPLALARLEPIEDEDSPREAVHLGPRTVIGRTPDNQLQIDQAVVSRRHAEIVQTESGYRISDLGSENGTYINGDAIEQHDLIDGDRIQIGSYRYLFRNS
jgi:hypothetical protein